MSDSPTVSPEEYAARVVENEEFVPVLVPGQIETLSGTLNGLRVAIVNTVVGDPNTGQSYVIALVFSHEAALEWSHQLRSVGSTVPPISKQLERIQAAVAAETEK